MRLPKLSNPQPMLLKMPRKKKKRISQNPSATNGCPLGLPQAGGLNYKLLVTGPTHRVTGRTGHVGYTFSPFEGEVGAFPLQMSVAEAKIPFPQPLDRLQPLARIHRNRQRLPSNGSIERAKSTSPDFTLFRKAPPIEH
jgi:hypothetical protein